MKKIIFGCIILIMLAVPITGAADTISKNNSQITESSYGSNQEFTHSVLAEYGTMTTCPPCVNANAQLKILCIYFLNNFGKVKFSKNSFFFLFFNDIIHKENKSYKSSNMAPHPNLVNLVMPK